MKVFELKYKATNSNYPIKDFSTLNIYSEYFLVDKNSNYVFVLRYFKDIKKWYVISLQNTETLPLDLGIDELCDIFDIYCIPEYTGGIDDVNKNREETIKERNKLLRFLIEKMEEER